MKFAVICLMMLGMALAGPQFANYYNSTVSLDELYGGGYDYDDGLPSWRDPSTYSRVGGDHHRVSILLITNLYVCECFLFLFVFESVSVVLYYIVCTCVCVWCVRNLFLVHR
jgi:hypothetical protein